MLVQINKEKEDICKEDEPFPEEYIVHRITKTQTNNNKHNIPNQSKIIRSNSKIIKNTNIKNSKKAQIIQKSNSFKFNNQSKNLNYSKEKQNTNYISTNNNTNNILKTKTTHSNYDDSKYNKYNIQQIYYNIQKDYSYLHINKDEEFLNRMQFDINKRQLKEDRVNKLVEQNKIKIDEDDKIEAFNRLIKDANRRLEAKENLEIAQKNAETDIVERIPVKKYNEKEWNEIYKKRFKNYEENKNKKIEENIKINIIKKINDENEQINLCHTKKASKKHIEENAQRMYDEAKKRKIKINEKIIRLINNNYDDDPSKYIKKIKSQSYSFVDNDEYNTHDINKINSMERNNYYIGKNKQKGNIMKKEKGMAVSEFNNKRFEKRIKKSNKNSPFIKCNNENLNEYFFNNNTINNNENEKNKDIAYNYDKNYNFEEERNKLIQMANIKNLQQDDIKNENNNNNNKNSEILGEVNNLIDQFILKNLNNN